jgi:hypothetical protein
MSVKEETIKKNEEIEDQSSKEILEDGTDPDAVKKVEAEAEAQDQDQKEDSEKKDESESKTPVSKAIVEDLETEPVVEEPKSDDTGLGMSKDDLIAKLLTDPDNVINEITQKVIAKVDKRSQDEIEYKQLWNKFYDENPDLSDFKDIVNLKAKELRSVWAKEKKDPPWSEGQKTLAEAVRTMIKRVRGSESDVEEVGNSKAVIASSSGNSAPRSSVKGDSAASKNFADQIQKFQAKFSRR